MTVTPFVLGIDIGGTKVTVARFQSGQGGALRMGQVERFASREHASLEEILLDFAARAGGKPSAAGIGVAGPVVGRRAVLTNLPWTIDADQLQEELEAPVYLMNDLEAHGYGIPLLAPGHVVPLNAGRTKPGNAALIAAGTGLGEAILVRHGNGFIPSPTEGGHTSFAPRDAHEADLLLFLLKKYEHVSWERVVSGIDGFGNLVEFLTSSRRIQLPPSWAAKRPASGDLGPWIQEAAVAGEAFALETMSWFARLYGAEAGNLALKALSLGGMYIGGGIAPKILPWLKGGSFMQAFVAKGRFRALLQDMPVNVITDPDLALKGAAAVAHARAVGARA